MSLKNYIYSFLLIAFCASCEDATKNSLQEIRYTVASKKVDCVGIGPQKCFLIKKNEEKNWQYFYSSFNDFNYEEG